MLQVSENEEVPFPTPHEKNPSFSKLLIKLSPFN